MSNLSLRLVHPSDTMSQVVDKVNDNFDQIMAYGGGPRGFEGKQGKAGIIGKTGAKGIQGIKGDKGSQIFYDSGVLVDGTTATTSGVSEGDLVVDSAGSYFIITKNTNNNALENTFQFNLITSSAAIYLQSQTSYQSVGNPANKWILRDGGSTGNDRNLVIAKRIAGVSNDITELYRMVIGSDAYPGSTNTALTVVNIIPDAGGTTLASASPFTQLSLKYRKDTASAPSFNSGTLTFSEDSSNNPSFVIESGGSAINLLKNGTDTIVGIKGKTVRLIGLGTNYASPTAALDVLVGNTITLVNNQQDLKISLPSNKALTLDAATIAIPVTSVVAVDGLTLSTVDKLSLKLPLRIHSELSFAVQDFYLDSAQTFYINNPKINGTGTRSYVYNFVNTTGNVLAHITGGVAGQRIEMTFSNTLTISSTDVVFLAGIASRNYDFGERLHLYTEDGITWKEYMVTNIPFTGPVFAVTNMNNMKFPGLWTSGMAAITTAPSPIKDIPQFSTANSGMMINKHGTGYQQFNYPAEHGLSVPSDKLNPIYTRRIMGNSYQSKWNKLLSEYGGNRIHDAQRIHGATIYEMYEIALPYFGSQSIYIPDDTLRQDDSAATFYHIVQTNTNNFGLSGQHVDVVLPLEADSLLSLGRMVWLNFAYKDGAMTMPYRVAVPDIFHMSVSNPNAITYLDNISPDGEIDFWSAYSNDSLLSLWICVPNTWGSYTTNFASTKKQLVKWVMLWSSSNGVDRRNMPDTTNW